MFTVALFIKACPCNQPGYPVMDERFKQIWYIYTMEYYSAIKKNKIMSFAVKWMVLEIAFQTQEDKNHMFPFICRI
jgi:hypothetical protein